MRQVGVLRNRYADGMRPTQADVAARAHVSRALVSLVFRDAPHVSDESRRRILAAADELGYRPNMLARSLASKQVRTFGVLLNDITNPFFARLYVQLTDEIEAAGFDVLAAPGLRSVAKERQLINTLLGHQVGGLILISPLMSSGQIAESTAGVPTVSLARDLTLPAIDVVTNNELVGARLALRHLSDLGHTRIVHIAGGRSRSAVQRRAAYVRVMKEMGLARHTAVFDGDFTQEAGKAAAQEMLASRRIPTAVFAANDMVAVGAMGVLESAGMRVPEDISVVGYDNSLVSQLDLVALTTVEQSIADFAKATIRLLIERIQGQRDERVSLEFEPRLIVRRSTARVGSR